jgi:ketosteroid isomerase-like protein
MTHDSNERIVLDVLAAVERRDPEIARMYHPDIEFHWPPSLPYGGVHRGAAVAAMTELFARIWIPLQPTESDRRMEPRVVASRDDEVVVRYVWKGRAPTGETYATDTLALYRVREGKLARAQMFLFDLSGLESFLARFA